MKCKSCCKDLRGIINHLSNGSGVQEFPTGTAVCENFECKEYHIAKTLEGEND